MLLASVAQLEARLGEPVGSLSDEDLARATAVLEDASAVILSVGDPGWTEETIPPAARVVVLRLAHRMWTNPEGLSYEAMGDHVMSRASAASLLTPDERGLVMSAAGFSPGVYSVKTPGVWS